MTIQELKPEYQKLLKAAINNLDKSYAPYSKFNASAAVLISDGGIITGNNIENAAWASVCAERAAILTANTNGKRDIIAIAVTGIIRDANGKTTAVPEPVAPCGTCRQFIFEFAQISNHDIDVIMSNTDGSKVVIKTINELLPMAYGPKDLGQ